MLLLPDEPPGIIDVSPYRRPPSFAEGVVIADALWAHGASPSLLDEAGRYRSALDALHP